MVWHSSRMMKPIHGYMRIRFLMTGRLLSKLNLSAVAGYSYQYFLNNGLIMQAGDFLSDVNADNIFNAGDFKNGKSDSCQL